ncbi:MAG: glutamate--tRNA ligase [Planctomycetaceae bacterium]|nr:glutamate--tRNA ligase [Planctomycetaceae bacterium]
MVRTRFAPSPTGYLHIGGVRTALFNWLFARKHGGQFLLRIDDTDQSRNVEQALQPILEGFRWLGIDWDEGPEVGGPHAPYFQSQRTDKYQAAVEKMLSNGTAYKDYSRTDEIQAEREAAQAEKCTFVYSRNWMAETNEQAAAFEAEGRTAVVRLKMPRQGTCLIPDLIRGDVEFEWAHEQDMVIQKADGTCLYHLASVVDDAELEITHVIRAEEHLSNTPRQIFIARSLGYELPQYAHLPYVAEPGSKNKLSKRKIPKYLKNHDFKKLSDHGAQIATRCGRELSEDTFNPVIVDFYRDIGFLPHAVINYLLLLGWSLDGEAEEFTLAEMINLFSLERVVKSPASFDPTKLMAFQQREMDKLDLKKKTALCVPYLQQAGLLEIPPACGTATYLNDIITATENRITVAGDILDYDDFFTDDEELSYDPKAFTKRLINTEGAREILTEFRDTLNNLDDFNIETVERAMREFVEAKQIKFAEVIHPVRVSTTGKPVGFGLFETLVILGKERCIKRINLALDAAEKYTPPEAKN